MNKTRLVLSTLLGVAVVFVVGYEPAWWWTIVFAIVNGVAWLMAERMHQQLMALTKGSNR